MKLNKIFNNKTAKGIVSLLTIVIVLMSVLASTIYYNNNITANVIKEIQTQQSPQIQIKTIDDINELNQFNEGWYAVRNGLVYYLEGFNSYVPLHIGILDKGQQNGFVLIEADGNVIFETSYDNLLFKKPFEKIETEISTQQFLQQTINQETQQTNIQQTTQQKQNQNQITGAVTGLESVTGMQVVANNPPNSNQPIYRRPVNSGGRLTLQPCTSGSSGCYRINPGQRLSCRVGSRCIVQAQPAPTQGRNVRSSGERSAPTAATPPAAPVIPPEQQPTTQQTQQQDTRYSNRDRDNLLVRTDTPNCQGDACICTQGSQTCVSLPRGNSLVCNNNFCRPNPCCVVNDYSLTAPTASTQPQATQPRQEEQISRFRNSRGNLVVVTHSGNNYFIDIQGQPQRIEVPANLVQGVDFARDFTSINNLPLRNGGTLSITLNSNNRPTNMVERDNRGTTIRQTEITYDQNNRETGRTETRYNTQGATTSQVYTFTDGTIDPTTGMPRTTTRTITYNTNAAGDTSVANVAYSTTNPRTGRTARITVSRETYVDVTQRYGSNTNAIMALAAQEGFRGSDLNVNDQGALVSGNRRIERFADDFFVLDGSRVTRGVINENGAIFNTYYSGDVVIGEGIGDENILIGRGASYVQYDSSGGLAFFVRRDGDTGIEVQYNEDTATVSSATFDPRGWEMTIGSVLADGVREITDTTSQFYGMIELRSIGNTYYMEANQFPFGSYTFYQIVDGQRVEVNEEVIQRENGPPVISAVVSAANQQRRAQGRPTLRQQATREFFADVERAFTEFRGLGYIPTLFGYDAEWIHDWRETVDKAFADLYLGSEYWESEICASHIDSGSLGFVYAETPQGITSVAAHIEGKRTAPIDTGSGTEYLYKITFEVKNGDTSQDTRAPEEMKIKVMLKKENGQFVDIFDRQKTLARGQSWKKAGQDAIVDYSSTLYTQVCLEFDHIPSTWQLPDKRLCNNIPESTGEPTTISQEQREQPEGEPSQNDF